MGMQEVADIIGVPQFYIQETVLEHIGDGNVRLAGCILQRGILVPQYYSVMSYRAMIRCGSKAVLAAQNVMMDIGDTVGAHH